MVWFIIYKFDYANLMEAIGLVFAAGVMLMFRRVGGVVKRDRMKRSRGNT